MSIKKYIVDLNAEQKKAVTFKETNLLILAGAGSGKTRVLVTRIAYLIDTYNVSPFNIMAVTFTNKAAREMKERLVKMIDFPIDNMWVGTFHGIANKLLRLHHNESGLKSNFKIIDGEEQLRIIKKIHKSMNLSEERWPAKQTQWFISDNKDRGVRPSSIDVHKDVYTKTLTNIYIEYSKYCNKCNLVDFSELILRSFELLVNNEDILKQYKNRFNHVFVDEFQDTNNIQYAFIKLLVGDCNYLTAVGDDDQSIYGWRGANVENIWRVSEDFNNVNIIRLEQNYRSTKNILSVANAVISKNKNRMGKNLWTDGDDGDPIIIYSATNDIDEATFIVLSILRNLDEGISRGEIAILYRSNAQSRILEEQLIKYSVPYKIYGGLKFFDRAEIKDIIAYLRLIEDLDDDISFERIVNLPTRGIGASTINILRSFSVANKLSLFEASKQIILGDDILNTRALNALSSFVVLLNNIRSEIKKIKLLEDKILFLISNLNLREHYIKDRSDRGQIKVDNLYELVNAAKEFEEHDNSDAVQLFLEHIALESGEFSDEDEDNGGFIQLMTLHAAKGLEFPVIYMAGMEHGLFPHQLSLDSPDKFEEERRLCYVGMTRAMQKLYISHARVRRLHGNEQYRRVSSFLKDIPCEFVQRLGQDYEEYSSVNLDPNGNNNRLQNSNAGFSSKSSSSDIVMFEEYRYYIGQQVIHSKFGVGTIIGFEGGGELLKINVNFESVGQKLLAATYAKLKPVNV